MDASARDWADAVEMADAIVRAPSSTLVDSNDDTAICRPRGAEKDIDEAKEEEPKAEESQVTTSHADEQEQEDVDETPDGERSF